MPKLLSLAATLPVVASLAACGGTPPAGGDAAPPAAGEPAPAFAPDAVLVDWTEGPGFTPVTLAVDRRPSFRLYGDGSVLVAPPETRWTGGFPELETYRLTAEGIDEVLAAAERHALLTAPPDYGMPAVTDLGTTTVALDAGDGRVEHSAYALGFEDEAAGLTETQNEARGRLTAFLDELSALPEHAELLAAPPEPYEPEALDVYAFPFDGEVDGAAVHEWPAAPLAEGVRDDAFGSVCTTLRGADVTALRQALEQADPFTVWRSGGKLWTAGYDAVLPGEPSCGS